MSQIEVGKAVSYVATGPQDEISVPKAVMYVLLIPGESSGGGDTSSQGHVYFQKITR